MGNHGKDKSFASQHNALFIYVILRREFRQARLQESEFLTLPGETKAGEDDYAEVPVRLLNNFTIYWKNTKELVPISELSTVEGESGITAQGETTIWREESPADEEHLLDSLEDYFQPIQLSEVTEFNTHHIIGSAYHHVELNP